MVTKVVVTFEIQIDDRRRNLGEVADLVHTALTGEAADMATLLALGTGETEQVFTDYGGPREAVRHATVQAHTHREAEDRS